MLVVSDAMFEVGGDIILNDGDCFYINKHSASLFDCEIKPIGETHWMLCAVEPKHSAYSSVIGDEFYSTLTGLRYEITDTDGGFITLKDVKGTGSYIKCKPEDLIDPYMQYGLTMVFDNGKEPNLFPPDHECEFIDNGFSKELWCKHEGCKNTKGVI